MARSKRHDSPPPSPPAPAPPRPAPRRIERLLARLGLLTLAVLVPVVVLAVDVALSPSPRGEHLERRQNQWSFELVTRQGQSIGGTRREFQLELSPFDFYHNRPGPGDPPTYRFNRWGCRGGEPATDDTRPVLLVLGGSAALGLFMPEEKTWPALLEQKLPERQVQNAGTVGYLAGQQAARFATALVDLSPRWVLAFDGWNDLYDPVTWFADTGQTAVPLGANSCFSALEQRLVDYRQVQREPLFAGRKFSECLVRNSTLLSWLTRDWNAQPVARPESFPTEQLAAVVTAYADHQARLDRLVRGGGGKLLVVLQPEAGQLVDSRQAFPQDAAKYPAALYERFRRQAIDALAQRGVWVVDASQHLQTLPVQTQDFDFLDTVHLSATGHQRMADWLAQVLTAEPDEFSSPRPNP